MDGLSWKTLLKWMIWGYPYFWKHPYIYIYTYIYSSFETQPETLWSGWQHVCHVITTLMKQNCLPLASLGLIFEIRTKFQLPPSWATLISFPLKTLILFTMNFPMFFPINLLWSIAITFNLQQWVKPREIMSPNIHRENAGGPLRWYLSYLTPPRSPWKGDIRGWILRVPSQAYHHFPYETCDQNKKLSLWHWLFLSTSRGYGLEIIEPFCRKCPTENCWAWKKRQMLSVNDSDNRTLP